MIIPNLSEKIIKESISVFNHNQEVGRKKDVDRALTHYNGQARLEYLSFISPKLANEVPAPNNNVTKRIMDRVSLVYMESPIWSFPEGNDTAQETYDKHTKKIAERMQIAERRTNLLGVIGIRPFWGKDDQLQRDLILHFKPFFVPDEMGIIDFTSPDAVIWETTTDMGTHEVRKFMYYDDTMWKLFDANGKTLQEDEHGLDNDGKPPIVFATVEQPTTHINNIDIARDLIDTDTEINVLQLDSTANIRFQSFGQFVATGIQDETSVHRVDPSVWMTLPDGASANVLSPPDTVSSINEAIKQRYKFLARNYHLPEDFVDGAQVESGVAIKQRNIELNDDRKSDTERWRNVEGDLYKIERQLFEANGKGSMPDEISVDYRESIRIETDKERQERTEWEIEIGYTTAAKELQASDQDKYPTVEDAQNAILANKKETEDANLEAAEQSSLLAALREPVEGEPL